MCGTIAFPLDISKINDKNICITQNHRKLLWQPGAGLGWALAVNFHLGGKETHWGWYENPTRWADEYKKDKYLGC